MVGVVHGAYSDGAVFIDVRARHIETAATTPVGVAGFREEFSMPFDGTPVLQPVPVDDAVTSTLVRARNRIDRYGWGRGHYYDRRAGTFCILGALSAEVGGGEYTLVLRELVKAKPWPLAVMPIALWNDLVAGTKADVLALFDAAIQSSFMANLHERTSVPEHPAAKPLWRRRLGRCVSEVTLRCKIY
jgi:hypothetical protein